MLKKILLIGSIALFASCAAINTPVPGLFYSNIDLPGQSFETADDLEVDLSNMSTGSSSAVSILGLFAFGDASIAGAAANGQIKKIHHYDFRLVNFLGIISTYSTTVFGQE